MNKREQQQWERALHAAKKSINDGMDKLDLNKLVVAIDVQRQKGDKVIQMLKDLAQEMFMINGNLDALKTRVEMDKSKTEAEAEAGGSDEPR